MAGLHDRMNPADVRMGSLANRMEPPIDELAAARSKLVTGMQWI
jgi:hypothetical protein